MKTTLLAPLGALALAFSIPCQAPVDAARPDAATAAATAAATDTFVLDAGSLDVAKLINHVATYLDYNILYSEQELASLGQIRLTRRTEVDRRGCWELFGSLLYYKGLAVIVLDEERGFFEVIAMNGPRGREVANGAMFVPCDDVDTYANQKATPILTTVPLRNINATIATNALRPFFAASGSSMGGSVTLGNVGNSSDMLLQGFGPQVAAAYRLLKLIDVGDDSASPQIQVVRLEHAAADDLVARIDEVFNASARQAVIQQGAMQTNMQLRVVAHPALNALILSGSTMQVSGALELIAKLDLPAIAPRGTTEAMTRRLQQLEERVQKLEHGLRGAK